VLGALFVLAARTAAPGGAARAADWPQFRADSERSAFSSEDLPAELSLSWIHRAARPPEPAWPRSDRLDFDAAYEIVVAGGLVVFGTSSEGKIHALDAETGGERWRFVTDAPVRFAPALWEERVYAGSDDGHLYALALADGRLLWKTRLGPRADMVLGNERLISRWPLRGGPAVRDGAVYCAAGIWPTEGIFIRALDARTGETLWRNDDSGAIAMGQPHPGAEAASGVSAQGHVVVTADQVFLPTGRAVPAAFRRADGAFEYYHLQKHGHAGGATAMASAGALLGGGLHFDAGTGERVAELGPGPLAATRDGVVRGGRDGLTAYRWVEKERTDRKGETRARKELEAAFVVKEAAGSVALLVAGTRCAAALPPAARKAPRAGDEAAAEAGAEAPAAGGRVLIVDLEARAVARTLAVEGAAHALAAAEGRLYASTDTGVIHCFSARPRAGEAPRAPAAASPAAAPPAAAPPAAAPAAAAPPPPAAAAAAPPGASAFWARAAEEIAARARVRAGYVVDLGAGEGSLALELARRTDLRIYIYAVEADREAAQRARARLEAAGLLGARVTVHERPLAATSYPGGFADLVVSARSVEGGAAALSSEAVAEARRLRRPYGGILSLGEPGAMELEAGAAPKGAGEWTHQYADPANTACSGDAIRAPLQLAWFRDVGQRLTQRHGRGPAPLFLDGRIFSEGQDSLVAVDAYNGRLLWEYPLPGILHAYEGDHLMGTAGTHGNYCVTRDGVYIRRERHALRIDPASGVELARFEAPAGPEGKLLPWGYIASEGGRLYGTLADPEHVVTYRYLPGGDLGGQLTESVVFFALDALDGRLLWEHRALHALRHNAIAIGGGRVYLIDRSLALFDRRREEKEIAGEHPPGEHPSGVLRALDARSGEVVWESREEIYGTTLVLGVEDECLVMGYQPTHFRLASEVGGMLAVFDTASGKRRWEKAARYASRPLVNGRTIYAEGGAWDLVYGEERPFRLSRSYGCGVLAGGANLLVYRSATLGYFDLLANAGNQDFGGLRPGCWINAIPAGGRVLVPDGAAGCRCSYQNQAWIALEGR
jgi:outer membrane protein assembly factor BamB